MSPTAFGTTDSMSCRCCQFLFHADLFLPNHQQPQLSTTSPTSLPTVSVVRNADQATVHPAERNESIIINPRLAWDQLVQIQPNNPTDYSKKLLLVDTHSHAHLERQDVFSSATENSSNNNHIYSLLNEQEGSVNEDDFCRIAVMSCAVDISDWESCLEYATASKYRIPALGIHPWYVESVLASVTWLDKLEQLLQQHPGCMVGEIGLCKVARFLRTYSGGKQAALLIQRNVFVQQLVLAAKYDRPVSIHCVNQHGVLLQIFNDLHNDQIPPAMALHSYTGTVHHIQSLLKWEAQIRIRQRVTSTGPLLYFGFSHSVNYIMCTSTKSKRQCEEALRSIPRNRLLIESDVHCTDHVPLGSTATISFMAHVLNETIEDVAALTTKNGLCFFQQLLQTK